MQNEKGRGRCPRPFSALISRILSPAFADGQVCIWDRDYSQPQAALLLPRVVVTSTALHRSKDFAVAPACCHAIIPKGASHLSARASLFAPLASRRTGVTRYPSPAFRLAVSGLSSPQLLEKQLPCAGRHYPTNFKTRKFIESRGGVTLYCKF